MRKLFTLMAAGFLAVGLAGTAKAIAYQTTGLVAIQIATLDPVVLTATYTSLVNGSGGPGHLLAMSVPQSPFATVGLVVPVTDPAAAPIGGVQVTAHNAAGGFIQTGGGTFAGQVSINGVAKVCLFGPCSAAVQNLNVPLSNVGQGGAAFVNNAVKITVVGSPWTTGTVAIATISQAGFAHGPASLTSSTANPSGVVGLVTPIFISTNISASAVVPAFGFFTAHFVPEPGTMLLLGSGIAGLVLFGRTRKS
jgi:hypothetical protein